MKLKILREQGASTVEEATPPQRLRIIRSRPVWNLHAHSRFSAKDALPQVKDMVATVASFGQPALGLTDHGNVAGSVQLYLEARKAGIAPFPGTELYVVPDRGDKKAKRHHMCVVAYTIKGYENLVNLSSLSHLNFHNKPLVDHADLATLADQGLLEGIAATSGCFFSLTSQAVVSGEPERARALLATYAGWFPKFYVELQNHNIDHDEDWNDDRLADELMALAGDLGLPCVLTQDAHYCTPEERETHDALKRFAAFGPEGDDAVFPGDGFHLADDAWFRAHHHESRYRAGCEGLGDLLDSHDLKIAELDSYSYNIPFTVADPYRDLWTRCSEEMKSRGLVERKGYLERLTEEMAVIKDTGMAGYLVLVAEVTDWCRDNRIFYQARGSASGSIVCWLLGITQVDPVRWKLRFERFISRDRTKPPDIDLDVEHDRRADLMAWLASRFAVHQIGTWAKFSLEAESEEDYGIDEVEDAKGSLRVAYYARLRAEGKEAPAWGDVPAEDKHALYLVDAAAPAKSYGVHPAGLVVTTTAEDYARLVPLMWVASSKKLVSQYPMKDIEALGLVKLDVLGLKTLTVLNRALTSMGRDVRDGLDWIGLSDKKTYAAIGRGDTDGVFQLEGWAARRGCQDLKPTKIADIVAAMALFRPATQSSGATRAYIERKHRKAVAPERHPIIETHTRETHGVMLYQEQVIAILRELGMDAEELTSFLAVIKASQKHEIAKARETIAAAQSTVRRLCTAAGMSDLDFHWLWSAIEGFGEYGFNQAHSTAYGLTAYRCAYLSVHHELDFFTALLDVAATSPSKSKGQNKESLYITAARQRDIRLLRADVNVSGVSYTVDPARKGIRKGLNSIKNVGTKAAMEIVAHRPEGGYESLEQLCRLVHRPRSPVTGIKAYLESGDLGVGVIEKLYDAGALECFEEVK